MELLVRIHNGYTAYQTLAVSVLLLERFFGIYFIYIPLQLPCCRCVSRPQTCVAMHCGAAENAAGASVSSNTYLEKHALYIADGLHFIYKDKWASNISYVAPLSHLTLQLQESYI